MSRLLLALAALMLLSACNSVLTEKPLFTQADEQGAPKLREGVWLIGKDGDCHVDETKPIDQWPDCAGAGVVRPGELDGHDKKEGKDVWQKMPFIFAAGDPRIIQARVDVNISVSASAEASGNAEASASASGGGKGQPYAYAGAVATKLDDQGRVVALSYWPVLCGPPPPKDSNDMGGTKHPLPGMVMDKDGGDCTTRSTSAIRAAAKASKAWTDRLMDAHWLREGDK